METGLVFIRARYLMASTYLGISDQEKMFIVLAGSPRCGAVCSQVLPANHDYTTYVLASQVLNLRRVFCMQAQLFRFVALGCDRTLDGHNKYAFYR